MLKQTGLIFDKKDFQARQPTADLPKTDQGLNGDSGVGQAPEFPLRSSSSPPIDLPIADQQIHTSASLSSLDQSKRAVRKSYHSTKSRLLSRLGSLLMLLAILGFLFTYGPILRVELGYRLAQSQTPPAVASPKGGFAGLLGETLLDEVEGVPDPNFSLIIPKIHAKSRILPNVSPADETEYFEALKTGIAHAKGTNFPGSDGNIYLFAHSTDSPINIVRYNAVFYLLRELDAGDEVQVYFSGVKHRYQVTDKKIVEPTDVTYLSPVSVNGREQLILQTCWPPGTRLKRLLVFAEKGN